MQCQTMESIRFLISQRTARIKDYYKNIAGYLKNSLMRFLISLRTAKIKK